MRILFVQLGRIGDMILSTPVFRSIKEKFPEAEIDVIAGRHNYSVLSNNPRINKIIIHKKPPFLVLVNIFRIRKHFYDYLIDPKDHYSRESRYFAWISKANKKIGYNQPSRKIYDIGVPGMIENKDLHFTLRHFQALKPLGIETPEKAPRPELFPSSSSEKYVKELIAKMPDKRLAVINISASKENKMWQYDKWIRTLKKTDLSGWNVAISSAPAEYEMAKYISEKAKFPFLFRSRKMDDIISLIKNADILITPDTSLVHVASAFNVPLFGLFSGLNVQFSKFKPLMDDYTVIRANEGDPGILSIESDDVIEKLKEVLDHQKNKSE